MNHSRSLCLYVNIDIDIDDLKKVIHINGIDTTKSTVLPKDLILWKVCLSSEWWLSADLLCKVRQPEPLEPHKPFFDRVSLKISNLVEAATQPGPSQKISTLFPQQPPQDSLHIIVQIPSWYWWVGFFVPVHYSDYIAFYSPSSDYPFSSVTAGSVKRSPSANDDDHPPPKRPRTGDVVPDIDPLPSG